MYLAQLHHLTFNSVFNYLAKIQDAGSYNFTSDVVNRFYPCMMSGLAYYLSQKYSPDRSQELERRYESELLRALDADNQGTSTFISPQTFYGDGVKWVNTQQVNMHMQYLIDQD